MLKRTIYIGSPSYLSLRNRQLKIKDAESQEEKGSIPIEDMAILVIDHPQTTITSALLEMLMAQTVVVVNCDARHLPNGMMLPLQGHSALTQRWHYQIEASLPLKKQLWKQTVHAKIQNQMGLLIVSEKPASPMVRYLAQLTSGDETNMEGIAAQHYWKHCIDDFSRNPDGPFPNNFLNYGYAILRALVARALVASGLLPALGIFHHNKYNPYCLADDIMEPYRPYVDQMVITWMETHGGTTTELTREAKAYMLGIATHDVVMDGNTRPLMVALTTTTASLFACYEGSKRQIAYPVLHG